MPPPPLSPPYPFSFQFPKSSEPGPHCLGVCVQELTEYQQAHKLRGMPNLLEYLSYVFASGNLLAGESLWGFVKPTEMALQQFWEGLGRVSWAATARPGSKHVLQYVGEPTTCQDAQAG